MPRLILHIGTHKTATTSIQQFLFHHRETLAERGVFYPDYTLVNKKPHYAHLGMVNALSGRHKVYSVEQARRFFARVRERAVDFDTTLISAEPFNRHVMNEPEEDAFYTPEDYWPRRHAYINHIREIIGDAEVVVVFRRQADYAQSLYQEHVKVTRYNGSFREFLNDFWFHFVFLQQARAWDTVFPGLKAMTFDRLVATGDPTAEFCRLLALPIEGLDPLPRANEGLPVDLVVLKRMLHRTSEEKEELRKKLEKMATYLPDAVIAEMKNRSFFGKMNEMKMFQSGFDIDNAALRPFLLHDLAKGEPVFPTEFRKGQHFGDWIKPAVLQAMLNLSLREQP